MMGASAANPVSAVREPSFPAGALVSARGRDWVVLPESAGRLLILRPLGGTDAETAGIHLDLEDVASAAFAPPPAGDTGDWRSGRLLRDALRLGFRSGAGPFRSFGRLGFDPRPYQLVPLMLALRQATVRLLIADDVGVGKTVEAGLIARELLDREEIRSLSVLCLPHLVEQWQRELREKFHIEAEAVKSSTAARLERDCQPGESLFARHPFTVCSVDLVKGVRWAPMFARDCPDCVIVDEAHACVGGGETGTLRRDLLELLSARPDTHLILATATPHSGREDAFRFLLSCMDPAFRDLPADLSGPENEPRRRAVARCLVQRRRADIREFAEGTAFPRRMEKEITYALAPPGRALLDKTLAYARGMAREADDNRARRRMRWWSALTLLRGLSSSPAAAAEMLRRRAGLSPDASAEEVDRQAGMDLLDRDGDGEAADFAPGADVADALPDAPAARRRLSALAREAESLRGEGDPKMRALTDALRGLMEDGFHPIVFCRFVPTAEYVAGELRAALPDADIRAVTGGTVAEERQAVIARLMESPRRALVCTDCLSEGVNLQEGFDAVVHYDLSWNPTRHEQREGRVDRFGQPRPEVRALTLYGRDNPVDGMVLDVLLRKHRSIRSALGVSVPLPGDADKIVEALFEALLLRDARQRSGGQASLFDPSELIPVAHGMLADWEAASEREKRSRTFYAQHSVKPAEVEAELSRVRAAVGAGVELERFVHNALESHGAVLRTDRRGIVRAHLADCPLSLREALAVEPNGGPLRFTFGAAERDEAGGLERLTRAHPLVERLAAWTLNSALDPHDASCVARRAGVVRTDAVAVKTVLLLLRMRFHLVRGDKRLLAEDCAAAAFTGAPDAPAWLSPEAVEGLLAVRPSANTPADAARAAMERALTDLPALAPALDEIARRKGGELLEAHARVRAALSAGRRPGGQEPAAAEKVEPRLPPDVLGLYVYLPLPRG